MRRTPHTGQPKTSPRKPKLVKRSARRSTRKFIDNPTSLGLVVKEGVERVPLKNLRIPLNTGQYLTITPETLDTRGVRTPMAHGTSGPQRDPFDRIEKIKSYGRFYAPTAGVIQVVETQPGSDTYDTADGAGRILHATMDGEKDLAVIAYRHAAYERFAAYFLLLNKNRANLTKPDIFIAGVRAGRPENVAINNNATQYGFVIGKGSQANVLHGVDALLHTYSESPRLLDDTLKVIAGSWLSQKYRTSGHHFAAVAFFIAECKPDMKRLLQVLQRVSPQALLKEALTGVQGKITTQAKAKFMAGVLGKYYNRLKPSSLIAKNFASVGTSLESYFGKLSVGGRR